MSGTIYRAIDYLLIFIQYAIFARVIISWIPIPRDNRFIRLLYQITEPVLAPLREIIGRSAIGGNMMFDSFRFGFNYWFNKYYF